jgi:hypothetical protein
LEEKIQMVFHQRGFHHDMAKYVKLRTVCGLKILTICTGLLKEGGGGKS